MPVFSDLPAAALTLLGDQLASGFAAGHADMHLQPGSDVAVYGAGPVGLGAIQAGRVMGAGQVIAIDPIKYRREFALKMGATIALDPVAEGDGLVERVRELCRGANDRRFASGVSWGRAGNVVMARGADFVVEAAGIQAFPPKVEAQPDPTNGKTVQQAWDSTRMGGHAMRDIPRYVKFIEKGKIDATSMITKRYTLENSRQAVQDTADRTIITGVIEFA